MYSCMCSNVFPVMLFIIPSDFNNVLSLICLRIMKHLFLFKKLIKRLSFMSFRWVDGLIIDVTFREKKILCWVALYNYTMSQFPFSPWHCVLQLHEKRTMKQSLKELAAKLWWAITTWNLKRTLFGAGTEFSILCLRAKWGLTVVSTCHLQFRS